MAERRPWAIVELLVAKVQIKSEIRVWFCVCFHGRKRGVSWRKSEENITHGKWLCWPKWRGCAERKVTFCTEWCCWLWMDVILKDRCCFEILETWGKDIRRKENEHCACKVFVGLFTSLQMSLRWLGDFSCLTMVEKERWTEFEVILCNVGQKWTKEPRFGQKWTEKPQWCKWFLSY